MAQVRMSVYYPQGENEQFDHDYYRDVHIPLCQQTWQPVNTAVDQLGLEDDLVVPGGEVLALRGHSAFVARHTPRLGDHARQNGMVYAAGRSGDEEGSLRWRRFA